MTDEEHGDLAVAAASAASGVPMVASTLVQDPMEDLALALGETPGLLPAVHAQRPRAGRELRTPGRGVRLHGHRRHPRHLVARLPPARPAARDLPATALATAWPTTSPIRCSASRLAAPPEEDRARPPCQWALTFGNPALTWDDLAWLRGLTELPLLLKGICHPDDVRRAKDGGVDGIYCSNHGGRQVASAPGARPAARRWSMPPTGCPCSSTPACALASTWSRRSRSARRQSASAGHTPTARRWAAPPASSLVLCVPAGRGRPDHGAQRLRERGRAEPGGPGPGRDLTCAGL